MQLEESERYGEDQTSGGFRYGDLIFHVFFYLFLCPFMFHTLSFLSACHHSIFYLLLMLNSNSCVIT